MMTEHEYEFLTGQWKGPKGAAFNQVFEFSRSFGWCAGFDTRGVPVLTKRGIKAIKAYQADESMKRSKETI